MIWVISGIAAALVVVVAVGAAFGRFGLDALPESLGRGARGGDAEGGSDASPDGEDRATDVDDANPKGHEGDVTHAEGADGAVGYRVLATPATTTGDGEGAAADAAGDPSTEQEGAAVADGDSTPRRDRGLPVRRLRSIDIAVASAYGLIAFWLLGGLFADVQGTYLSQGVQDQQAFEWYFGAAAHNLVTWSNALFSDLQNYPLGVNLMANASVLGLSIPFVPVTWYAGPQLTFVLIEWVGYSATATAWYLLFVRRLGAHRVAAGLGGLLVAFSPGMVSHGNGHPNFLAQFLIPVIIDRLIALQRRGRTRGQWVRSGIWLGLLVTWQLFMGEEVLLLATIGIGVTALMLLLRRRLDVRAMLPGLLVGAATAVVLCAFPLWWQFFGPQSYRSMWQPDAANDLASLWGRATRTVGADPWASAALSMNRTEENAFFGMPLWLFAGAVLLWKGRRPVVGAAAAVVVVSTWISLGAEVKLNGQVVHWWPGLWPYVSGLPFVESVLPTRLTLVAVPGFAVLLVVAVDAALRGRFGRAGRGEWEVPIPGPRWPATPKRTAVVCVAAVVALLPLVPTPLVADPRPAVPAFFTSGTWRSYVSHGSVLAIPPPDIADMRAADWQATARWQFPLVEGYFMGPGAGGDGQGARGAIRRPFSQWLAEVDKDGMPMTATAAQTAQFRADLAAWHVDAVVLAPRPNADALRESVRSVLGDPVATGGVWVWDVRSVVAAISPSATDAR